MPGAGPGARPRPVAPAVLLVVLLWGGSYSGIKAVQAAIPAVPLATFRCAVAALVMLAGLLAARPWPRLRPREWATIALLGLAGTTVFHLGMVSGLALTTPAHAALLVNLSPLFASVLAAAWLGERLAGRRLAGILLALTGMALIVGRGDLRGGALLGDLLALAAALGWTVYSVAGKPMLARHPPLTVTGLAMVVGTLPLLPLGLPGLLAVPWRRLTPTTWLLLAYLSVGTIVVAYLLWYWALARAATARVVVYSYLIPLVAATISIALGQDVPTPSLVAGAVAVVGGVALTQLGGPPRLTARRGPTTVEEP